jgi:hypothetical protein
MLLQPTETEFAAGIPFLRSKVGVSMDTVNITGDDIEADGDGKKSYAIGTVLYKKTDVFYKIITSGDGTIMVENREFAILAELADVTDGDGSFKAVKTAANVREAQLTPTLTAGDKAILRHQFQVIS